MCPIDGRPRRETSGASCGFHRNVHKGCLCCCNHPSSCSPCCPTSHGCPKRGLHVHRAGDLASELVLIGLGLIGLGLIGLGLIGLGLIGLGLIGLGLIGFGLIGRGAGLDLIDLDLIGSALSDLELHLLLLRHDWIPLAAVGRDLPSQPLLTSMSLPWNSVEFQEHLCVPF